MARETLCAAVDGPFFPDWEFTTLFGSERDEVREVLADWPHTDDPGRQFSAVNNAMNNLLGYPHGRDNEWSDYLSVDRDQLAEILWRIREVAARTTTPVSISKASLNADRRCRTTSYCAIAPRSKPLSPPRVTTG
ncbi:MAG: hypothetical protein ACRDV3_10705 [Acidothermaceae bacterium]